MATTAAEIQTELQNSILQSDSTLDITQGAIPDIFITPQAGQLANASADAESLRQLFTLQFGASITAQEIQYALGNYGFTPGAGTYAQHVQYFMRFTRPLVDVVIPSGSLVSNVGGDIVYRVVNGGTIIAASAPLFYNSSRKTYEIGLLVQAVGVGTQYKLPANRVITLLTPISGIDSTENRSASTGGAGAESMESQISRLQTALLGINLGSPGGIINQIKDTLPELITDVAVIQPFEQEFYRMTTSPALDVYVIGDDIETYTQTYTALGGETQIALTQVPATTILSVTINGVSASFTLVNDPTLETGYSLDSNDICVLGTTLAAYDTVVIEYEFDRVLQDVYNQVFASGSTFLFNTDILLRQPFKIPPVISGTVQALSSYSVTDVEANVLNYITNLFTFTTFTGILYPEIVRENLITQVSGVQNFILTEFRRSSGSLSLVEPVVFARNEISVFSANYYNIAVVS